MNENITCEINRKLKLYSFIEEIISYAEDLFGIHIKEIPNNEGRFTWHEKSILEFDDGELSLWNSDSEDYILPTANIDDAKNKFIFKLANYMYNGSTYTLLSK